MGKIDGIVKFISIMIFLGCHIKVLEFSGSPARTLLSTLKNFLFRFIFAVLGLFPKYCKGKFINFSSSYTFLLISRD